MKRFVTYRIGENKHFPRHKTGNEISEETNLNCADFLEQTEQRIGPVSLLWMAHKPMPKQEQQELN